MLALVLSMARNKRPSNYTERIIVTRSSYDWRQVTYNIKEDIISLRLFVGNLYEDTTQMELEDLFSEFGQVSDIFLPTDPSSGRSKGFAFVELAGEISATTVIDKLDGQKFNGKNLRVSEAEDRTQRSSSAGYKAPKFKQQSKKSKGSRKNIRSRKRGG